MKKVQLLKKSLYLLAALCLVIGLLPITHITEAFADEGSGSQEVESTEAPDNQEESQTPEEEAATEEAEETAGEGEVPDAGAPAEESETGEEPPVEGEPVEEPAEEASPVEDGEGMAAEDTESFPEETVEEMLTEETLTDEALAEEELVEEEIEEAVEEGEVEGQESQDLSEIIELLNEEEIVLENDEGEAIPLSSNEATEVLGSSDPFFWNPASSQWEGYTVDGTGCPANVVCLADPSPFQAAVDAAPDGSTIYVAQDTYNEDVVVNTANLSFVGFSSIDVADASSSTAPTFLSGYAVMNSITLNVDFGTTLGVYADYVTVNSGGKLDDGLSLADVDGEVEASVVLYSADGHYRIKDANNPDINYEWECGEPDTLIYPGRVYRMVFKKPLNSDILDYYTNIGDETEYDRSALTRINDLIEGIKQSENDLGTWTHTNEERIFWYLLGMVGDGPDHKAANGTPTELSVEQKALADAIINRLVDTDLDDNLGIWFLWPILEGDSTEVSPFTTQLTFMHYVFADIPGCMDVSALNYNPKATVSDGSCEYCVPSNACVTSCGYPGGVIDNGCGVLIECDPTDPCDPGDPGDPDPPTTTFITDPPETLIPVTGAGGPTEELVIIPVTGVDLGMDIAAIQKMFLNFGMMVFGITLVFEGLTGKRQK